ncbi:MAG: S16 family serine protease [Aquihabitans sp.]
MSGVKQKLMAAHRLGLTEIIIPARNEPTSTTCPGLFAMASAPRERRGRHDPLGPRARRLNRVLLRGPEFRVVSLPGRPPLGLSGDR